MGDEGYWVESCSTNTSRYMLTQSDVKTSNKVEQLSLVIGEHQRETETPLEIL